MNTLEQAPDFSIDLGMEDFDLNMAFQDAMTSVATSNELALDDKIRRMEVIISEGTSDVYRDFVDLRMIAAQMEMFCNHDHALNHAMEANGLLSSFMGEHKEHGNHSHTHEDKLKDNDETEIDPKTGKKKKKKRWTFF